MRRIVVLLLLCLVSVWGDAPTFTTVVTSNEAFVIAKSLFFI
jgi:hypothetical protein